MKIKIFELVMVFGLVSVILFSSTTFLVQYEIPKVFLFNRLSELLLLLTVFQIPVLKERSLNNRILLLSLAFIVVCIISALFGVDPGKSFWGNYYRNDGLFTLFHLVIFSLVIALYWKNNYLEKLSSAIAVTNIVVSSIVIYHVIKYPFSVSFPIFGNPNFLAGYLIVTLPLTLVVARKSKYIFFTSVFLSVFTIFLTESVTAVIGLLVLCVGSIWVYKRINTKQFVTALLCAIILGFLAFVNLQKVTSVNRIAESRRRIYTKAFIATTQRPLFGWGWANFDHAFRSIDWPIHYEQDAYVDKAHGHILEISSTTGLLGLSAYLLLTLWVLKALTRKVENRTILLSLILFLFHSQTNVISIAEEMFFWLYVGVAISYRPSLTGDVKKERSR